MRRSRVQAPPGAVAAGWRSGSVLGPITQRSMDRNHFLLYSCHLFLKSIEFFFNFRHSIFDFEHNRRLNHTKDILLPWPSWFVRRTYEQYQRKDAKVEGSSPSRSSWSRMAQWKRAGPITQRVDGSEPFPAIFVLSVFKIHLIFF